MITEDWVQVTAWKLEMPEPTEGWAASMVITEFNFQNQLNRLAFTKKLGNSFTILHFFLNDELVQLVFQQVTDT